MHMAKEFLQSHQDLFVYAHKRNSNIIFCYPSSKQLCKSINQCNSLLSVGCWLGWLVIQRGAGYQPAPAEWLIVLAVRRGLLACCRYTLKYTLCNVYFIEQLKHSLWSIKYTWPEKCALQHLKYTFPFDLAHTKFYKFSYFTKTQLLACLN